MTPVSTRRAKVIALLLAVVLASGCGFSKGRNEGVAGWFDPYHDDLAGVNYEFNHNPFTQFPTVLGNVLFVAAFLPATAITGAFGSPVDSPYSYFEYSAAGTAYGGGAIVGGPFVLLNLIFVRWWYGWVFDEEPQTGPGPGPEPASE